MRHVAVPHVRQILGPCAVRQEMLLILQHYNSTGKHTVLLPRWFRMKKEEKAYAGRRGLWEALHRPMALSWGPGEEGGGTE